MPKSTPATLVVPAGEMSDEHLIRHLNARHPEVWPDFRYRLQPEGQIRQFSLNYRHHWDWLHERLHRGESWGEHGHVHSV